jgi:hypothetical protein
MFTNLNLTTNDEFDEGSMATHLDKTFTEKDWNNSAKKSFKFCLKEMQPLFEDFQKQSNFTEEQCDTKFMTVFNCMSFQLFKVRL